MEDVKEGEERSEAVHERDVLEGGSAESMENGSTQGSCVSYCTEGYSNGLRNSGRMQTW